VTGTLRIWGLNYLTDGKLAKYWEDGFRKYQPGINFSWFTPTALGRDSGPLQRPGGSGREPTRLW